MAWAASPVRKAEASDLFSIPIIPGRLPGIRVDFTVKGRFSGSIKRIYEVKTGNARYSSRQKAYDRRITKGGAKVVRLFRGW